MTIEYKDSKRIVGLADVTDSYTTESAFNTLSGYSGYGAEQAVSSAQPRKGIKILSGSSAIGKKIKKVASYLRKNGSPTGTFNFKVYRSGSVISTSADLDPSTLTSSFAQKELTLDTKVTLEADDRIVAEYSGSSSSMAVHMVYNNSANSIASGFNLTQWNGSAWSDSAYDLCFGFDSTPASYNDVTTYKPTNVQDNSLFVEKDTARRYWLVPALTPTYEDDFTSDNSVDQDASKISVNTAQERWDFNIVNDQTNDSSSIDITTALSDTNWVMDFDYTWTSLSGTTNVNTSFFGISNSNGTVPSQTAQDHIGVRLQTGSGFSIAGCHSNNGTMQSGLSATFTTIPSVTTLYFRIVRTSTTSMTVKIYTTSARTTVSEEKTVAVSASTTGLRYVKISPYEGTNGGSNTEVGYVKNLKIYNAVTSAPPATWTWEKEGIRGVFGGGETSTYDDTMDYITMATLGNATDFGNLTASRYNLSSVSSDTRGVFGGGRASNGSNTNIMDYITIATLGDATDFGDLTLARRLFAGVSSNTRGVFAGGYTSGDVNTMDYITIATLGNAIDFGDLTSTRRGAANVSSDVRGIFGGGYISSNVNTIDYITIATPSNATDFGDLTVARNSASGVSSDVRGVFGGGQTSTYDATMDYITIATLGNATDFGDMTVARMYYGAVSSNIRGIFGGGNTGSITNVIDYITITTTGNATDFGDLSVSRKSLAGVDNRLK